MAEYLYECHLHTRISSKCGRLTPEEVVRLYTTLGYAGVFVTDHFLNGNTCVDKTLPWAEKINLYAESYRQVKAAAEGTGLDVFFGVEFGLGNAAEVLLYGATPEWFIEHEEVMSMKAKDALTYLRDNGILVYQAHPMRIRDYSPFISLFPYWVDGIEVYNVANQPVENEFAADYAKRYGLSTICGSDIHTFTPHHLAALVSPFRFTDAKDIKKVAELEGEKIRIIDNPFAVNNES